MRYIDILVLTESKLENKNRKQYISCGTILSESHFRTVQTDRNSNWEWVMIYICKDIPSKLLDKHARPFDIEGRFGELSFRKCKWLLFGT